MTPLYAKSKNRHGEQVTLLDHSVQVEGAIDLIFPETSRWRSAWMRFFKIPRSRRDGYWKCLRAAALLHDIGKANEDFQRAVQVSGSAQSIRHEHLSALVLSLPQFRQWLTCSDIDPDLVIAAVLSHHIKASVASNHPYKWCQSHGRDTVRLLFSHPDFRCLLNLGAERLGLGTPPSVPWDVWCTSGAWEQVWLEGRQHAVRLRQCIKSPERMNELAALKAGLIACDALASGSVREGKTMQEWVARAHQGAISPDEIDTAIINPRATDVARRTGRSFQLHSFQKLAGGEGPRTLLLAPCGAGKTLAAWEWAKRQARVAEFGRVIFLYPTRGTATEGFRDYVGWAPEGDATLLHASSAYELDLMAANPPDSLIDKDVARSESEARMFALGLWRYRFFSATVDQFLSFMQNRYQSLCLLPALADSVVILDEVHSYDLTMFEMLRSFLGQFDIPVLCMTATLPKRRAERLLERGITSFPREEHKDMLADLAATAEHPRYRIQFETDADAAIRAGIERHLAGKRVLVVVNRVARCIEVAERIAEALGVRPLVYHSRFKLKDRQDRHRDVVDAFKEAKSAIAVTTQVCEMSLDLDAQVLVTEVAPVPSLIQRFGRANRHLKNPQELANVIVYPPAKAAPYEREELDLGTKFILSVTGDATQAQLADALENGFFSQSEAFSDDCGQFLTGGYFAVPGSFRDEDEKSIRCICDDDLQEVEELYREGKPIDGYVLPAPKQRATVTESKLLRHLGIVASSDYSSFLGFKG